MLISRTELLLGYVLVMFAYSTHALRSVFGSMNSVSLLSDSVWSSIKDLGISKQPRWRRGGVSNRQRIYSRSVPSVNNAVLNVNNDGSIPVRITDHCAVKSCVDSQKPSQKHGSRNVFHLSRLQKVTEASEVNCCFLNCHSLKERSSIMDLILKNGIQCLCLCETWLSVDEERIGLC